MQFIMFIIFNCVNYFQPNFTYIWSTNKVQNSPIVELNQIHIKQSELILIQINMNLVFILLRMVLKLVDRVNPLKLSLNVASEMLCFPVTPIAWFKNLLTDKTVDLV